MSVIAKKHSGAVSIFVVVFTALLLTIVTISFARLMLREQQRASNADLSQSAYDSALAGVEDAKRALSLGVPGSVNIGGCNGVANVPGMNVTIDPEGVRVGGEELRQWYSCVIVNLQTPSYEKRLEADSARLVPLKGVAPFSKVRISWFSKQNDIENEDGKIDMPSGAGDMVLESVDDWPQSRPPVLETQFIQTSTDFTLDQFDASSQTADNSNTNTLLLYPVRLSLDPNLSFISNTRTQLNAGPTAAKCEPVVSSQEFACSATIDLAKPVGGEEGDRRNAFLRLTARYKGADARVELLDSGNNVVKFDGVQPEVDSTGRASDLFRRVRARIEPILAVPYPEAAVDVTGDFCKTFSVTKNVDGYSAGVCNPNRGF